MNQKNNRRTRRSFRIMTELSETFKRLEHDPQGGSQHLITLLESFLMPFLLLLDEVLDKRLVRTLLQCLVAIIHLRNTPPPLYLCVFVSFLNCYNGTSSKHA